MDNKGAKYKHTVTWGYFGDKGIVLVFGQQYIAFSLSEANGFGRRCDRSVSYM